MDNMDPPPNTPYDKLKAALITGTSNSDQKQLHCILDGEQLGDRTPSQLLRRMKQLLGEGELLWIVSYYVVYFYADYRHK